MRSFPTLPFSIVALLVASVCFAEPTNRASTPATRAQALITGGLNYLKAQQKPDGSWQNEKDPPAITAIVLKSFVQSPDIYPPQSDFIQKGYSKLLSFQQDSGAISKDLLNNYNTAIAISSLAAANDPKLQPHIDKAVAYLKSIQWTEIGGAAPEGEKIQANWYGGWGYGGRSRGSGRPDLSNVQLSLDALHDAGLKPTDPAFQAALKFVTRQQNLSETNDSPWASNDGGFIYGPSADGTGESMAGTYTTADGQRRLRSYGSMTYAGLKSFIYAGLSKDDPRVQGAFTWITKNWSLEENPGLKGADPKLAVAGIYYYYMTLARALHAYGQPTLTTPDGQQHDWRLELISKLAALQKPDGSWSGEAKWMESNPVLVTSYAVLALEEAMVDLKEHPAR
jgi:squalene-hopene/tetraprenyl-beta-curcumene cyclase